MQQDMCGHTAGQAWAHRRAERSRMHFSVLGAPGTAESVQVLSAWSSASAALAELPCPETLGQHDPAQSAVRPKSTRLLNAWTTSQSAALLERS